MELRTEAQLALWSGWDLQAIGKYSSVLWLDIPTLCNTITHYILAWNISTLVPYTIKNTTSDGRWALVDSTKMLHSRSITWWIFFSLICPCQPIFSYFLLHLFTFTLTLQTTRLNVLHTKKSEWMIWRYKHVSNANIDSPTLLYNLLKIWPCFQTFVSFDLKKVFGSSNQFPWLRNL
jgi:hypothetical protein